jgi:hypothetical protein
MYIQCIYENTMFKTKFKKIGNSYAIYVPKYLVNELGVENEVCVQITKDSINPPAEDQTLEKIDVDNEEEHKIVIHSKEELIEKLQDKIDGIKAIKQQRKVEKIEKEKQEEKVDEETDYAEPVYNLNKDKTEPITKEFKKTGKTKLVICPRHKSFYTSCGCKPA